MSESGVGQSEVPEEIDLVEGQVQVSPVDLRSLLVEIGEGSRHQIAQDVHVDVLVDGGDALLEDLELLPQLLEFGLVRLLVLVAPVARLIEPHLVDDGIEDGRKHVRVLLGHGTDASDQGEQVGQGGDDGRADLVVFVREEAEEERQEVLHETFGSGVGLARSSLLLQDPHDVGHDGVDQLRRRLGQVRVVLRGAFELVERRGGNELRDDLLQAEKRDHLDLVLVLHLLGNNVGEGVDGGISDLVFFSGRGRPADDGEQEVEHVLVDHEGDIDPAHPLSDDLQGHLNHQIVLAPVLGEKILPRARNLAHVPLPNQILQLVAALRLVALADQEGIGNLIVDRAHDAKVQHDAGEVVHLGAVGEVGDGQEVVDEGLPSFFVEEDEQVRQSLSELILQVGRVELVLGDTAVVRPLDVFQERVLEEGDLRDIEYLGVEGVVDDFQRDMADYLGRSRGSCKETGTYLPSLGVGSELVDKFEGLALEVWVARWTPGDFNRVFDLCPRHGWLASAGVTWGGQGRVR